MNGGELKAIWIKRFHRGPMDAVPTAELAENSGIVGNADQGGKRQVTIIEQEIWDKLMKQFQGQLPPCTRRANLMVKDLQLANSRGRVLRIGSCHILIQGETRPCERMDEALMGLRQAMAVPWGGGAFGIVLDNGQIALGDKVGWEESAPDLQIQ